MNALNLKLFLIAFIIFIMTDMIWLGFIAKHLYFQHYAPWLNLVGGQLKMVWWATLLVYLLLALSVVIFIMPLAHHSLYWAAVYGAVLGAVIYGIYNFTCLAVFKDFPIGMSLLDSLWGTALCAWSSCLTLYLSGYLK